MTRGDLVIVSVPGDYGKPRPALIVRSDSFADCPSPAVLPLTSDLCADLPGLRVTIEPGPGNGLRVCSQIMIDKIRSVLRAKVMPAIGRVDADVLGDVDRMLAVFLGLR